MELHHLRYFVAVAEDLSFTRAARRLKMAQPPLSRQIRSLENEIGVQLFERRSGKVFLTDAGCRFLSGVRVALEQVELAVDVARQTMHGELGTVRVGFGKGLGDVVSLAINQHMRLFPKIEVDVRDILSGHQSPALLSRQIDVGFSHGPALSLDVASEKLFKESLSVVLARSSPLAKRTRLRLKDLKNETLLLIERTISPHFHDSRSRSAGKRASARVSSSPNPPSTTKPARWPQPPAKEYFSPSARIPATRRSPIAW